MKYILGTIVITFVYALLFCFVFFLGGFAFIWDGNWNWIRKEFKPEDREAFIEDWKKLYNWKNPNWPNWS